MAKKEMVENQEVQVTESVEAKTRVINLVTMADGSTKNFGERNKLLSDQEITDTSFVITFNLVNGEQISYPFKGDTSLLLEMAAFGAASKIKQACTGVKDVAKISEVITSKISEFNEGQFTGRVTGELVTSLSQIQVAYANINGIDVTTTEGTAKVNAIFAAMTKEDKSALYKQGKIRLEIASLRLAAAQAALAAEV